MYVDDPYEDVCEDQLRIILDERDETIKELKEEVSELKKLNKKYIVEILTLRKHVK